MSRQLSCPNCGAVHELANPGISMLVCDHCSTPVYWSEDQVLKMGKQSILPESDSRLFYLASGKLQGVGYRVIGHLRYDHGRGAWDEWYLELDDGRIAWVSEDERELSLEVATQPDGPLPPPNQLAVGLSVKIGGVEYTVREIGTATCVGGEGQLPFAVLPGETYHYADLASLDGTRFATLEYDEGLHPTCFVGHVLTHEHIVIDDEKPPSTKSAQAGGSITCNNCAGALEVPTGRDVETQVCEYCGAQLDLSGAEQVVVGINPENFNPRFGFEIGQAGKFNGKSYEVAGRMLYVDNEGYQEREYLLYNPDAGYLWLSQESGHFVLNRPTQQGPKGDPFRRRTKAAVKVGSSTFRFYESGTTSLRYVDGALPWVAKVNDRFRYADMVDPPNAFSAESDGNEVEFFHGRYMTGAEVYQAFGIKKSPPRAVGVHPAQPFSRGPTVRMLIYLGLGFAALNLGLLAWSFGKGGKVVFNHVFDRESYKAEQLSKPFTIPKSRIVGLKVRAPVNNSWVAAQLAIVNDQDKVVAEMDSTMEYYHGVSGGESWSEGSRSKVSYYKAPAPGTYRVLFKAEGGSWRSRIKRYEKVHVQLTAGAVLSRYFAIAFVIAFLIPLFEFLRRRTFEKRRWGPVTDDDD